MPSTSTDWFCIVNPHAGSGKTLPEWAIAEKYLAEKSIAYKTVLTNYKFHATELACEAARDGYRRFLAVGGDGSVHEVLNGILRFTGETGVPPEDFTLAVIPIGSGNDWIKSLGIPHDTRKVVELLAGDRFARQDVVRVETAPLSGAAAEEDGASRDPHASVVGYMANIGGVGLDADICHHTNSLKTKGYKGSILYKLVAPYSIFSRKRRPVEIVCDGETVYKGKMFTAVIGNGIYRGGGLRQNEEGGRWDDGLLEVSIQGDVSHIKGMQQMMHIFKGDFATLPGIITRRFKKMTLTPLGKGADRVESDGEIPGTLPLTVELTGQQIQILVP